MASAKVEAIIMAAITIGIIPGIKLVNDEWYSILTTTIQGKIAMTLAFIIVAFCGYKKEDIKNLDIEHCFTYDNVYVCLKNGLVVFFKNEIGELTFENIDGTDKTARCSISKVSEVVIGE